MQAAPAIVFESWALAWGSFRVLAKHRLPGQLGPKRVASPSSEIRFATVKNTPCIGCLIVAIFVLSVSGAAKCK